MKVLLISVLHCLKKSGKIIIFKRDYRKRRCSNSYLGQAFFVVDFEGWSDVFIYFWILIVKFCAQIGTS